MSIFRVKLTQGDRRTGSGNLDSNALANTYSIQRTMFCMGPGKINRKLLDGVTFTDCNYWKRFTYPTLPYDQAFIDLITDDGSVYVDGQPSEYTRNYDRTIAGGSTFATTNNIVDIFGDNGGYAQWASISVGAGQSMRVRINGLTTSDFTVAASSSFTYNRGDVLISSIAVQQVTSGASTTVSVQVGILSNCNS